MPSLKDLRNRISSVKATQKITKAMQMVAAAKLRRAQEAAENGRPYAERMAAVLSNLAAGLEGDDNAPKLLAGTGKDEVHLLIVCTAERGLCGAFNSSIAKLAREKARLLRGEGKTVKVMTVGRKGYDVLKRDNTLDIIKRMDFQGVKKLTYAHAQSVGHEVLKLFDEGAFDVAHLFYGRFVSVISQVPTAEQIIPAEVEAREATQPYEYEPDEALILEDLLPRNVSVQIFRALLENAASEQGARMSAMDNATRNAGDMINRLTLDYNRKRQAQITKELIEIISGAEAL
jgi:F-type H+-transporting ATPase subunit gamma